MNLDIIILAAGNGVRMQSNIPKVLHHIGGDSLIQHCVKTALSLNPQQLHIVYGAGKEQVIEHLHGVSANWILQAEQLGTGHAVQQAVPYLSDQPGFTLVLYADVPLIRTSTLKRLLQAAPERGIALLTAMANDPTGLGRVLRRSSDNAVLGIVEDRDADPQQRAIKEIFTGIMVVATDQLSGWLKQLNNQNTQGEYYLTDLPRLALAEGQSVQSLCLDDSAEAQGINDKQQLATAERYWQLRCAKQLLALGAIMRDPHRFDLRGEVLLGSDVMFDVNVVLEGNNRLGDHCQIGPNTVLRNVQVGANVTIGPNCVIEGAVIDDHCQIGPFARIRPGTHCKAGAKVGNFVEVKNTTVGEGSKVNHLSYIGDAQIGAGVNIGASVITCNYDGHNKHQTVIEDDSFIGCGTQLIAPLTVAKRSYVGAGSTIVKDTPPHQLTLSRSEQMSIEGWVAPRDRATDTKESS